MVPPMLQKTAFYKGFALSALVLLAGCAPGDIALEGKIFEVAGIAGTQQGGGRVVKLADRAPLVVPPDTTRLPVPGETGSTIEVGLAEIKDPDQLKKVDRATLEKQQAAYCREHYELPKARGDETADLAKGPLGDCRPSILSAMKKWGVEE